MNGNKLTQSRVKKNQILNDCKSFDMIKNKSDSLSVLKTVEISPITSYKSPVLIQITKLTFYQKKQESVKNIKLNHQTSKGLFLFCA